MRKWTLGGANEEERFDEITHDAGRFRFVHVPADPRGYGVQGSEKVMSDDELVAEGPPWDLPLDTVREIVAELACARPPSWLLVLELADAARANDEARAAELVAAGADPSGRVFLSETPLRAAIGAHHWTMVSWLVAHGADPRDALTPVRREPTQCPIGTIIANFDDSDEAEAALVALLDAGARWSEAPGRSPLFSVRSARMARVLVARGAPINVAQTGAHSEGSTPLFFAIGRNDVAVMDVLVEGGADLAYRDERGRTAVMQAVLYCHVEALDRLIAAGADVHVPDANGRTPLEEARRLAAARANYGGGPASYAARAATIAEHIELVDTKNCP